MGAYLAGKFASSPASALGVGDRGSGIGDWDFNAEAQRSEGKSQKLASYINHEGHEEHEGLGTTKFAKLSFWLQLGTDFWDYVLQAHSLFS